MAINFIVNPYSGRGRGEKAIKIIKEELNSEDIDFDIQTTTAPKEAITLAKYAVNQGYNKIVAVGGDGTLNEVITGILQSDPPYPKLGLIAAGTGNNFARSIDLPLNLKKACHKILSSNEMKMDIGQVNDRFFINSVGIGFNSIVANEANQNFKHLHGTLVYMLAALKVMPEYKSVDLEITLNTGELIKGKYLLLVIGNGKIYSKTLDLIPEFGINDGYLDLCLIAEMSKAELMTKLPYFLTTQHQDLDQVLIKKIKEAKIKLKNTDQFHIDGEILHGNELKINILPQILRVII
ncbi:diacylglycerol/lipid kinase family protein [Selenihalanaerobacter shriftii]|uniref:Lipid kinase, YegS/Rv2252/BmrU family n=1 Tax=Selenihalanaerobacter shriftii TaxID=142842 RepID=A0A1T4K5Y1_9FIRM|nr:diacylglycerol kinase family protein [Selenihalanaerobacter shriftii]SJZ37868.1 lipid kinase, YegS/Rv2252/BmrU family [Selenihalanaerobacter shriftii]